ncbi:MAG: flavodoxin family protein [Clostridia bacterium]|nr:MAG: flavodoxin family protein [Clostridia bacterium]
MLLVALNGSPRRCGNTARLLQHAMEAVAGPGIETQMVHVSWALEDQDNPFCRQCSDPCQGKCWRGKRLEQAYATLFRADALLVGSPVYFGTLSGQLKAFWDKSRVLRRQYALLNVVGGALAVGSSRFGGQEDTLRAIHEIMLVHGMTIVGDGYWEEDCGHHGACAQKPAQADAQALERAAVLARRAVELAAATMGLRHR